MQPLFLQDIRTVFEDAIMSVSAVNLIVTVFAAVAKSNTALMADNLSSKDRAESPINLKAGRLLFQHLLEAAAVAASLNPCSHSVTPNARSGTVS